MTRKGLVAVGLFLLATSAFAAESAKAQKARQLLMAMKAGDTGVQVVDSMISAMKGSLPDVPQEFWSGFRKQIRSEDLLDLLVPVYERNLEERDIDALLSFYKSPTGQRFISRQPMILQESMQIGQRWGQQLAEKAIKQLQSKGYAPKM